MLQKVHRSASISAPAEVSKFYILFSYITSLFSMKNKQREHCETTGLLSDEEGDKKTQKSA